MIRALVIFYFFVKFYIGFWVFFTVLEKLFSANRQQRFFSRHMRTDFLCMLVNRLLIDPLILVMNTLLLVYLLEPYAPHGLVGNFVGKWPAILEFIVAIFFIDLTQYLRHRFDHAFLWSCHATHHSAVEIRWTLHFRLHAIEHVVIAFFDTVFLYILGFGGHVILFAQLFMAVHNMWLHTNINVDYGRLGRFFASPNYHKWHHAKEKAAIDRNFADLFVILDSIGGTYHYPRDRLPHEYGVHDVAASAPVHQSYLGTLFYPYQQAREWLAGLRRAA